MLKWKIMTNLLILLCEVLLGSTFFIVNCKCNQKNKQDYDNSVNIKISTYQFIKNVLESADNSFLSTNGSYTTLELVDKTLNDETTLDPDSMTESLPMCPHPHPRPPQPFTPEPDPNPVPLCPEESQKVNLQEIVWPETEKGKDAKSHPLCLDEKMTILKRNCQDNWDPVPDCKNIQSDVTNPCPADLLYIPDKYCYKIIEKTSYPPKCPYPETIEWDEYEQLNLTEDPIWMPVTRENTENYGIDVMRFTESIENYKLPYEICTQSCRTYFYSDTFLDKMCQVYHNTTHVEAVRCDQKYTALCVYYTLPHRTKSYCSQTNLASNHCKQSGYDTRSPCFCEATNNNQIGTSVLAEFLLPYQNLIYSKIDKSCYIGLEKSNNQSLSVPFIWSASSNPISYTNWASNVDINFDNTYGVVTSYGWILEPDKNKDCILYQIASPTKTGTLQLDIEEHMFRLIIKNYTSFVSNDNGEPLVCCFTDADAISLIYRIQNFSKEINNDDYVYKFSPLNIVQSGPGNYWCEAFLYPDLKPIKSVTKSLSNYEAEYVAILKLKHYEEKLSSFPLREENLATLQNLFKNELGNPLSFFPRIFKLNDVDETKRELKITFHLSSASGNNTEEVFNTLKAATMAQTMFEFVDFRSVDYCPSVITKQADGQIMTWPLTALYEKTYPENGFCVTENVILIQRTCSGNFIDGAFWSEITENCTFYASSIQTKNLLNITNCTDLCDSTLSDLLKITENYNSFNTLDLVLTVNYLKSIADNKPDLEIFSGIISNLMEISRPVLRSSQLNFKATDLLLLSLDEALEKGDFDEYKKTNFAIKTINLKKSEIYGILLQNCSATFSNCDLVPITNTTLLVNESFISTNGIVAAIVLSPELYYQINNYSEANSTYIPKLILSIYYGSQLFVESNMAKFSNYVFGVLFPGFTDECEGPLSIYYFNNLQTNLLGYNCSYWNFNASAFSSWTAEGTENINQAVYCKFYHVTNFGIPSSSTNEYCDASQNLDTNFECYNKNLDIVANNKKSFVKYQQICGSQKEVNIDYEDETDTVQCTVYEFNERNTDLSNYCITDTATAISIECFENFNKEFNIFNIMENCTSYSLFNLSKKVLDHVNYKKEDCWNSMLDELFLLSENYVDFNDFDLLVMAMVMNPIADSNPDLQKIAGIVNNVMKISETILDNAQRNFRAIDLLLYNIEEALQFGDCNEWKTENFVIKCIDLNMNHMGLIVRNCSNDFNDCNLSPIVKGDNVYNETYFTSENVQAIIILDAGLLNQIIGYRSQNSSYNPKIIVSIYSGSQLFVELDDLASTKTVSSFVFGILLPDFDKEFENPIIIYYLNNVSNSLQYNCSYWKFNDTSYGSWITDSTHDNKQLAMCEFYHVTHFSIVTKFLNYGGLGNYSQNHLRSLNSTPYLIKSNKYTPQYHFLDEENRTCSINNEHLRKYENEYSINDLMINILNKMQLLNNNYYIYPGKEYQVNIIGSAFPPLINNYEESRVLSRKKPDFNQTGSFFKQMRFNSLTCFNEKIKYPYHMQKENRNITHKLEAISNELTNENFDAVFAKLEHLLLKINLNDLTENTIELIAQLLQKVNKWINASSLKKLGNILNILTKLPRNIIKKAQTMFKSADSILSSIDIILQKYNTTIQIENENIIFLIISKEDILNFFGFYVTKDKKVVYLRSNNNEENKADNLEIDFSVKISSQLHDQVKTNKTRMIFVIFYNDIYFPDKENSKVNKPIVEVLFPDILGNLKANFTITYNNTNNLSQLSQCSYWDHLVQRNKVVKSGSWKNEFSAQLYGDWVTCVFNHATHFALVTSLQNITTDLEYILNSNLTGLEKLIQVNTITYESYGSLISVDIFLISQIIGNSLAEGAVVNIISNIISNLFNVPHDVLKQSQADHTATDMILSNVDKMAEMLEDIDINHSNFSLMVKDLNSVNLTGVLLRNCKEFVCTIDQITDFINISDYTNDDTMSAMVIFSQELIQQIRNLTTNSKVVISIYYSNVLFNEIDNERNTTKVFGIMFPGLNSSLEGKVSVVYNIGSKINDNHQCAYWSYKVDPNGNVDNDIVGKWENETSKKWQGQIAICNFSHVTHFAMLLSNNDNYNDNAVLDIITDIGCVLSLIGLIIILLTAIFFKKWRQNTGNKILINFSIAISLKIAMLYISDYVKSSSTGIGCTISGTILHYAILSECAWMFTIAILQFKRFVEVLGGPPKHVLVKALICGWVFPIIPVICVILIDPDNYVKGNVGLCYPSDLGLYLGVWLPVIIIVTINSVIFIFIIYNVFHKKTEYIDCANNEILFQWRLALLLFFMLGLTWSFGFLGEINGDTLFIYVFCITASLQGFVLFLFFIVFNKSTRVLYSHYAKQYFYSKGIFKLWQPKS